jgi:hypothetical protein
MITWFQRVFGKHLQWVLVLMLVILLLSCIVGIGAVPRLSQSGQTSASKKLFLGVDLNDDRQMQPIQQAVSLTLQDLEGRSEITQAEFDQAVHGRIALMYYADLWHLPPATSKDIENYIRNSGIPRFTNPDGSYNAKAYTEYHDLLEVNPNRDAIIAVIAENARLERVRALLGGPGYMLPSLANVELSAGLTKYDFDVVTLDLKKFVPKVDATDAALQELYNKDPKQFQRPVQLSVSYAKFSPAAVPDPTPAQLSSYVKDHAADFPNIKNPDDLGDQKTVVTGDWRLAQTTAAAQQAYKQSMSFARELDALDVPRASPKIDDLVKKYTVSLQQLPVITAGKPQPADSPVSEESLQEAYRAGLGPQAYFSAPLRQPDGSVVVVFLDKLDAPAPRTFAEAHDDVAAAYAAQEKTRQFKAYAETIRADLVKDMAAGKTFAEAAAAHSLTMKSFTGVNDDTLGDALSDAMDTVAPTSTATDQPAKKDQPTALAGLGLDLLKALSQPTNGGSLSLLQTLRPGEISSVVNVPDQGALFHVSKRALPPPAEETPEVVRTRRLMNVEESSVNANAVLAPIVEANLPKDNG